jgi:hypothetical protein
MEHSFSRGKAAARADSLAISEQDYSDSPRHPGAEPQISSNPIYHTLSASSPTAAQAGALRCLTLTPAEPPCRKRRPPPFPPHPLPPRRGAPAQPQRPPAAPAGGSPAPRSPPRTSPSWAR